MQRFRALVLSCLGAVACERVSTQSFSTVTLVDVVEPLDAGSTLLQEVDGGCSMESTCFSGPDVWEASGVEGQFDGGGPVRVLGLKPDPRLWLLEIQYSRPSESSAPASRCISHSQMEGPFSGSTPQYVYSVDVDGILKLDNGAAVDGGVLVDDYTCWGSAHRRTLRIDSSGALPVEYHDESMNPMWGMGSCSHASLRSPNWLALGALLWLFARRKNRD